MALPKQIRIRELGPREGFQTLSKVVDTSQKVALIDALSDTGLREIEVASFVRPDKVPQMADAEEVVKSINLRPGVRYFGLYLNQGGFERAENCGRLNNEAWLSVACSEGFLKSNANTSHEKVISEIPNWLATFKKHKKELQGLLISTAFGSSYEGKISPDKVLSIITRYIDELSRHGAVPKEISLADTMGWGTPELVKRVIEKVHKAYPKTYLSLHLHDTRGTGLANVYAGLEMGIDCFDTSVGGLGGCPFAHGAAGNVSTEDVVYMCEEMGVGTGVDLKKLVEVAKLAEQIVGAPLPGRYYKSAAS